MLEKRQEGIGRACVSARLNSWRASCVATCSASMRHRSQKAALLFRASCVLRWPPPLQPEALALPREAPSSCDFQAESQLVLPLADLGEECDGDDAEDFGETFGADGADEVEGLEGECGRVWREAALACRMLSMATLHSRSMLHSSASGSQRVKRSTWPRGTRITGHVTSVGSKNMLREHTCSTPVHCCLLVTAAPPPFPSTGDAQPSDAFSPWSPVASLQTGVAVA